MKDNYNALARIRLILNKYYRDSINFDVDKENLNLETLERIEDELNKVKIPASCLIAEKLEMEGESEL